MSGAPRFGARRGGAPGRVHVQAFALQKSAGWRALDRTSTVDADHTLNQAGVLEETVNTLTMVCKRQDPAGYLVSQLAKAAAAQH